MARSLRIEYPGAFYHITCRGNERRSIYRDDADRKAFLNRLKISLENYQVLLHAYVLMGNHFHLVLETPGGNLSAYMRHLNVSYTSYFNRRHRRSGHLYQGRFKAILIEAESYLLELSRYVHLNPIRVMSWKQRTVKEKGRYLKGYQWSSLQGYLKGEDREPFVQYEETWACFGRHADRSRRSYARFIEEGIRKGVDSPWEKVSGQVLLGKNDFLDRIRNRVMGQQSSVREQPSRRALARRWSAEEVIQRVGRELGRKGEELCCRGGGMERAVLMECLHRYAQESQAVIGKRMGGVDYSWVSRMRGELRRSMAMDAVVRRMFLKTQRVFAAHK